MPRKAIVVTALLAPLLGYGAAWGSRPAGAFEDRWVLRFCCAYSPPAAPAAPEPLIIADNPPPTEAERRRAVRFWLSGLAAYQQGEPESARRAWLKCRGLDPEMEDCLEGLSRVTIRCGSGYE